MGCSTGGFVDCLLRHGADRVYAVDRGYGVLAYQLRKDPRVVVMERTDALQLLLPEPVQLVTIDAGWTRQRLILPAAARLLTSDGAIVSLVKPHYEADPELLSNGVLPDALTDEILRAVKIKLPEVGLALIAEVESPVRGGAGNREYLWHLKRAQPRLVPAGEGC